MRERVLVTGMGCISCFGVGQTALVDGVLSGAPAAAAIDGFDTTACRSHRAVLLRGFDPSQFISPLKLRRIDSVGRVALAAAHLLVKDADASLPFERQETGVALGSFSAGLDSTIEYLDGLTERGPTGVPALLFSNTVANAAASLCAIEFGLQGPNVTFNQREVSSLIAIEYSLFAIRTGRIGAMMTGGVDRLDEMFFKGHDRFAAMSPSLSRFAQDGCRDEVARPFDGRHNGFVLGEGGYLLLLESAAAAERRGARVYGEVLGAATTSTPTATNAWPPDSTSVARAMRLAIADAGLGASDVDAVFAAANGSPMLDRLEASAIRDVFAGRDVPVVSLKGSLGENASSGAAALAVALLTLSRGIVPPTVGFGVIDPEAVVSVSAETRHIRGTTCLVNSVASGGTACSLVLRAAQPSLA